MVRESNGKCACVRDPEQGPGTGLGTCASVPPVLAKPRVATQGDGCNPVFVFPPGNSEVLLLRLRPHELVAGILKSIFSVVFFDLRFLSCTKLKGISHSVSRGRQQATDPKSLLEL